MKLVNIIILAILSFVICVSVVIGTENKEGVANSIIDQQFIPNELNGYTLGYIWGKHFTAQSFIPSETRMFDGIELRLKKYGYPEQPLVVGIKEDNRNEPVKEYFVILFTQQPIGEEANWVRFISENGFELVEGKRYWIVPTCFNCDEKNSYEWRGDAEIDNDYLFGGSLDTIDDGKTWSRYEKEDMGFRIIYQIEK